MRVQSFNSPEKTPGAQLVIQCLGLKHDDRVYVDDHLGLGLARAVDDDVSLALLSQTYRDCTAALISARVSLLQSPAWLDFFLSRIESKALAVFALGSYEFENVLLNHGDVRNLVRYRFNQNQHIYTINARYIY